MKTETEILVDFVQRLQPKKVLEVGCNTGKELSTIEHLTKTYGVDRNGELTKGKRNLLCAEGNNLPFNSNYFDFVYTDGCLSHNEYPEQILDEMLRVSREWILLIEWVGAKTGTSYSNCKQGISWIHDYEKLVSTKNIKILFNRKVPIKADLFHVLLLRKDKKINVKIIERTSKEKKESRFLIKLGKFRLEIK